MVAKSLKWALASLMAVPPAAFALGLGDIHLNSALNAPLDADIELIGATPEELASLKPQIASRETFARQGLDWPAFLSTISLKAVHLPDGRDVIKLRSTDVITEPFVTLLVEVNWDRGRYVHEYTVLLDPPVYTPGESAAAAAPVVAATTGAATREGAIERPAPAAAAAGETAPAASAPSPATAEPAGPAPSATAAPESYEVKRGDSLSRLAARFGGTGAVQGRRWMVATYQANPGAFEHNMNLLRSGAVLRIPEQSAVDAVTPADAAAEVHRQYASWRSTPAATPTAQTPAAPAAQEPGRLRLVAPTETPTAAPSSGAAPGASGTEVKALQGRVQELQAQLDESRRLLDLRNQELAQLQAKAAQRAATAAPAAAAPEAPSTAKAPPPPAAVEAPPPAPAEAPPAEASPPVAAAPAPQVTPESAPTATPAPAPTPAKVTHRPAATAKVPERSIFETLTDYWWAAALVVVALLGAMGFRALRARRESGFDDSLGRLAAASADSLMRDREPTIESTAQIQPVREDNFLVEESGSHERPAFAGAPSAAPPRQVASDETISSETAINLDQGDPLAEADFHMAYGLYDQAADLVRIAIMRDPARRDLKLKLLEVFFVWGNKEQFLQTARGLAETRAQAVAGEWEKIVIMGKQLAPEDPLFSGGAAVSGAAAAGVDLDLEGGQSRVDFDVLGEQLSASAPADVDLDIGTAIGERDPMAEAAASQATDKNLALREEDTINRAAATGTTRQMTAQLAGSSLLDESSPEAPTVEQPALQSQQPALRQKVEMALKQGGAAEHTTELAIDDLGLDLGSLDTMDQPALASSSDAPTLVAGLDERSRRLIETAAHAQHAGNGASEPKTSETGSWNFDADALGEAATAVIPREDRPIGDVSATSRLAALKPGALDFDIGGAEEAPASHQNGSGIDLDIGTATVPDAAFTATQRLGNEELALPDLEPVTMSEVGTKLDLARAYMDMGDPEGARNILEEVMHEGSTAQKQEAQRLIESLPG